MWGFWGVASRCGPVVLAMDFSWIAVDIGYPVQHVTGGIACLVWDSANGTPLEVSR